MFLKLSKTFLVLKTIFQMKIQSINALGLVILLNLMILIDLNLDHALYDFLKYRKKKKPSRQSMCTEKSPVSSELMIRMKRLVLSGKLILGT